MTGRDERLALIQELEKVRGSIVLVYVTSTRQNMEAQMAADVIPFVYEHLVASGATKGDSAVDLLLHTNGGDGIVPWRLVNLIREFAKEFNLLVPHHCFSAGTLMAMGSDRVIMHPMGVLGPIDPTIVTPFNPVDPQNPAQRLPISVEDVASYIALVRDDVGIRHEEELVQAFRVLADQVHPLALGNIKRSTSQSRMMGQKLLRLRGETDEHTIQELVEKLASQIYYHGHPINRREARDDLKLDFVEDADPPVADVMWRLYQAYVRDMKMDQPFDLLNEATGGQSMQQPAPPQQMGPGQFAATMPTSQRTVVGPVVAARLESRARSDVFAQSLDVTINREWNGQQTFFATSLFPHWEQEA